MTDHAPIALSCGEPAGIGPEIATKAWAALKEDVPFFYIGDPNHLDSPVAVITHPREARDVAASALPVLTLPFENKRTPGAPQHAQAQGVIDAIAKGVELVQTGQASALTTCPIHKKALKDGAGFGYPGHTEYLAALAGVDDVVMMLACDALRVVPATIHIALADVPMHLTTQRLRQTIKITHKALQTNFGIVAPRIAVAGLNPHAGEGGAMGAEEITLITPTLEKLRAEGLMLSGPHSADTLFHPKAREGYDAVVAMYHDQALIPIKTIDFDRGVNVTLGLPFIRTSPDHGTAFDIAGTGKADPTSLIEALKMAQAMAASRT